MVSISNCIKMISKHLPLPKRYLQEPFEISKVKLSYCKLYSRGKYAKIF